LKENNKNEQSNSAPTLQICKEIVQMAALERYCM
jgi:hypothetical protein